MMLWSDPRDPRGCSAAKRFCWNVCAALQVVADRGGVRGAVAGSRFREDSTTWLSHLSASWTFTCQDPWAWSFAGQCADPTLPPNPVILRCASWIDLCESENLKKIIAF